MKNWIKILIAIICISAGVFLFLFNKKEPAPKSNYSGVVANIKKPIDTSDWTDYINGQLGFSIKIPQEVFMLGCRGEEPTYGPMRVFEDSANGRMYIVEDYYDNRNNCVKVVQTLDEIAKYMNELAKQDYFPSPYLGWSIIINNIGEEQDILKYAKENFGSGCSIDNKDLEKDGNYRIYLKGERNNENDPWWGSCPINFSYRIIYSPEKQKMMSVALGQECKFHSTDPELRSPSYQCYDEEMVKTFKFE